VSTLLAEQADWAPSTAPEFESMHRSRRSSSRRMTSWMSAQVVDRDDLALALDA
jgi:hypothetical protein